MLRRLIKMMYVNDTAWNRLVVDYCGFFFFYFLSILEGEDIVEMV